MTDVIYKRSFYDKACRAIVGIGLLYSYTKGVVAVNNFKSDKVTDYRLLNISGNEVLMYKKNNEMIKIDREWFTNNENKTFSVQTLDSIIRDVSK
jgi:hypothetical protein